MSRFAALFYRIHSEISEVEKSHQQVSSHETLPLKISNHWVEDWSMVAVHMVIRRPLILGYKFQPAWFGMVQGVHIPTWSMPGRGWVPVGRQCDGSMRFILTVKGRWSLNSHRRFAVFKQALLAESQSCTKRKCCRITLKQSLGFFAHVHWRGRAWSLCAFLTWFVFETSDPEESQHCQLYQRRE